MRNSDSTACMNTWPKTIEPLILRLDPHQTTLEPSIRRFLSRLGIRRTYSNHGSHGIDVSPIVSYLIVNKRFIGLPQCVEAAPGEAFSTL
jgi:hypothetical protein